MRDVVYPKICDLRVLIRGAGGGGGGGGWGVKQSVVVSILCIKRLLCQANEGADLLQIVSDRLTMALTHCILHSVP